MTPTPSTIITILAACRHSFTRADIDAKMLKELGEIPSYDEEIGKAIKRGDIEAEPLAPGQWRSLKYQGATHE